MELDHTDYYKDFADYTSAFQQLADKVKKEIFIPKGELQALRLKPKAKEVAIQKLPFKHVW
jgi:UDP-N-acetylmuramate-alanine ligase